MKVIVEYGWPLLSMLLPVVLVINLMNRAMGLGLYTQFVVKRSFTMWELRFPSSPYRLQHIINGIYSLPHEQSLLTLKVLKLQLYLRFVYITAISMVVFTLCMKAAGKMENTMQTFFIVIAWLQIAAIFLDAAGNLLLLRHIKKYAPPMSRSTYRRYSKSEFFRYNITVLGLVWSLFGFAYFMLLSQYSSNSLHYLLCMFVELVLFFILRSAIRIKKVPEDKNKPYKALYHSLFGKE